NSEWEYDPKRANHAMEFIENFCKHSKGKMGGKPFLLELWQKAMTASLFGFVHKIEGVRKYREFILIVARKNGKSAWGSAIALYMMIADGEPGPEIVSAATKKDQAKIIWSEAKRMVKKSPVLSKRIRTLVAEMISNCNEGSFKPLSSDSNTLDGLNVHCSLIDELHAIEDKNLYDVIVDGMTAREQPISVITTTAGTVREGIFDIKYEEAERIINGYDDPDGYKDERVLPIIYELDKREEWIDESCWKKANPGLGTIKNTDQLRSKVEKAKANPLLVKNLLTKDFNIRETSSEAWLTFEQLNNSAMYDIAELKPSYGIGGCDLSSTTDLTAAKVIFMVQNDPHIYVKQMYWLPEDLLEQRSKEDKIPYDVWCEQGLLRTTPGNSVHYKFVTEWFLEIRDEYGIFLPWIGYDRWSAKYWVEEMEGYFGKESMIPIAQGKQTLSSPMKLLGADLESKLVNYNNNPIDKWCLSNTAIDMDKNLNMQPNKTKNQRRRIDGTAALLNAYVVLQEKRNDYLHMM
ncbi:terminase large subunit, partial [Bacillus toyonensis]